MTDSKTEPYPPVLPATQLVQKGYAEGQDSFDGHSKIVVDQQFEIFEALGFCEIKNKYKVGLPDNKDFIKTGGDFMFIHEDSECCERLVCGPNRALTLYLRSGLLPRTSAEMHAQPLHLKMHKPFHCQQMCCCRPTFEVENGVGKNIGRIEDPCRCCEVDQLIFRAGQKEPAFGVGPISACSHGLCCPCCGEADFPVINKQTGKQVGKFVRPQITCGEFFGKTNRVVVHFNEVVNPTDRQLMFAALMLLELEYFECDKGD